MPFFSGLAQAPHSAVRAFAPTHRIVIRYGKLVFSREQLQ